MEFGMKKARHVLFAATLASILFGFRLLLFRHAPDVFNAEHEDMSYGWFVPLFSMYVLWTERLKLRESLGRPSVAGLILAVPFLLLGFLGARGAQVRLEIVGFAGLLVAVAWAFYGRRTAARVLFPAAFLLFCIPLATFLDVITVHLRLFASSSAFFILQSFGADVVQRGTAICAGDGSFAIDVAEPCSGLRSLFALVALTAGYAYFSQPTWTRRAVLLALSVPIAIAGNVVRIMTICIVANCASKEFATGFYHDYSGYVVFAAAIALMLAAGGAIDAISRKEKGRVENGVDRAKAESAGAIGARPFFLVVSTVFFVSAMICQGFSPDVVLCEAPQVHLGELDGWTSEELGPGEAELKMLPADTRIEKRRYVSRDGEWFIATVIVGGSSKSSIHRPELCLPAQGWRMSNPRTVRFDGVEWRAIDIESGMSSRIGFIYTFFNQEGFRTASHVSRIWRDVLDRSFLNRIDRWVMVTVNSSDRSEAALEKAAASLKRGGVVK